MVEGFDEAWFAQSAQTFLVSEEGIKIYRVTPPTAGESYMVACTEWIALDACRRLENEYALASVLDAEWACVPLAYIRGAEGPMLVFADLAGAHVPSPGDAWPDIESFLDVSTGAALALTHLHAAGVLHLGIKPSSLMRRPCGRVCLRSFGESISADDRERASPRTLYHDMAYCAPEQIRADTAHVDERSDLYALGITFYQLLTGALPLQAETPEQWLHAHLAVQPADPAALRSDIPSVLAAIILKLISKSPQDRYQTSLALHADLARCRDEWLADRLVTPFELDAANSGKIIIDPFGLFGRSEEIQALVQTFARVGQEGTSELLLVSGSAGAGKSALVAMLPKAAGTPPGYFAVGKCDQTQRTIPYAPLVQIIRSLTLQLLGKPQEELDRVAAGLVTGLGNHGSLICDLVPEVELIIGPSSPLPDLPVQQAQGRFLAALSHTFSAFASDHNPLVIVIDDLQWADASTANFVSSFQENAARPLLVIATYREEEAEALHLLRQTLAGHPEGGVKVGELHVKPLDLAATVNMVSSVLSMGAAEVEPLCEAVQDKTAGNPFFILQLLRTLVDDKILWRDRDRSAWSWDLDRLAHHHQADNVVNLLIGRLGSLPAATRDLLRLMACIGSRCEAPVVLRLERMTQAELDTRADMAIDAGLLIRYDEGYAFSHDRILEAAYALTDEATRADEHARIANVMIEVWRDRMDETAFQIASQIERAAPNALSTSETLSFVRALVLAARRAKGAAAMEQASTYLAAAGAMLGPDGWNSDYGLSFELGQLKAECDLINTDFASTSAAIEDLLVHARSPREQAHAYRLKAVLQTVRSDYEGAITSALAGLSLLGIDLPRSPDPMQLALGYDAVGDALGGREIDEIVALPVCTDPDIETAMSLLSTLASSFFINDDISFLHLAKTVELTLIHGITPTCPYGLSWYGVYIAHHYGAYRDGFHYGEVALNIVERLGYQTARTATLVALDQVSPWTHTLNYAVARAREAVATGLAGGDLGMACYACNHIVSDLLVMGEHLSLIEEEIERGLALTRQIGYLDVERIISAQKQHVTILRDGPYEPRSHQEEEAEATHPISRPTLFWERLYAGMSALLFGDYDVAGQWFEAAAPLAWSIPAHIDLSDFHLYHALAIAHGTSGRKNSSGTIARLDIHRAKMSQWTALNPGTFRNKLLLIEAEMARLGDDPLLALHNYELSANAAAAAGFVHEEALAHELAAKLNETKSLLTAAHQHLRIARDCYRRWGADAKVRSLDAHRPSLASDLSHRSAAVAGEDQKAIDLAFGMKAAQALSKETMLDRLIERLMTDMIIHAGAQYGALVLVKNGRSTLEAVGQVVEGGIRVSLRSSEPTDADIPLSVLNSVLRTRKTIVFDDALIDAPSLRQARTGKHGARSLLCLPLFMQGELIGVLHLENSLTTGVFTPERTSMLEILAPQAAISLETARLYAALLEENEQHARTEASLRTARAELARTSHLTVMGGLAASIAHEINQPLSSIVSNAGAAMRWLKRSEPVVGEALYTIDRIKQDSLRAAGIVRGLRALAKQAPANLQRVSVDAVIEDVLRLTSSEIAEKKIELSAQLAAGSQTVFADPIQIQQVVLNLINNAADAMLDVDDMSRRLSVTSHQDDGMIVVCVSDSGPGLDAATAARIFESFFTTKESGMGMGLAISRSIMEAHGGTLNVVPSEQRGCTFSFRLPLSSQTTEITNAGARISNNAIAARAADLSGQDERLGRRGTR